MTEEQVNTIEEGLQHIPEEVKDFIFGDKMEAVKGEIATLLETDEQKVALSNSIMFFLLGSKSREELTKEIEDLLVIETSKSAIKVIIQERIIDEILLLITVHKEIDEESAVAIHMTNSSAPSPSEVLANLGARLSQSSVIVPSKRDYSVDKSLSIEPSVQNITPSLDPYRELPEK